MFKGIMYATDLMLGSKGWTCRDVKPESFFFWHYLEIVEKKVNSFPRRSLNKGSL
jgi:hypothetical protein